jgi:predicted dehydrogenase
LVIVCSHHDTHAEFAERALEAGKHGSSSSCSRSSMWISADVTKVVVEKPFTISTEEADRVIAAQKKSGKILTVFQGWTSLSPPRRLFTTNGTSRPKIRFRFPYSASVGE